MTDRPILFSWDGEAMRPYSPFWATEADRVYVVGERYSLVAHHDRSQASHNAYFAQIAEAWHRLPEDLVVRWPSPEHLRKYALIKAGYRNERSTVCASENEAQRVAALIRPMDDYAIIVVEGNVVIIFTAKSQSYDAMGSKEFQESKDRVLDVIAEMI